MSRKIILKFIPLSRVKKMSYRQASNYYDRIDNFLEWYLAELRYICEEKECEDME